MGGRPLVRGAVAESPFARYNEPITALMEAFVEQYLIDPTNAADAYRRAGGSSEKPGVRASQFLSDPRIAARIAHEMNRRAERTKVTQDVVIHELMIIGTSDLVKHFTLDEETGEVTTKPGVPEYYTRAIQQIEYITTTKRDGTRIRRAKVKLYPKVDAHRLLAQHVGMLINRYGVVNASGDLVDPKYAEMDDETLEAEVFDMLADYRARKGTTKRSAKRA